MHVPKRLAPASRAAALAIGLTLAGCAATPKPQGPSAIDQNRERIQTAFERWRAGAGGPFELLADDAQWTIAGSSPLSRTYRGRTDFLDSVIAPFNARMASPLVPTVRELHADGRTVVVLFDGASMPLDGIPYRNTYAWFMEMHEGRIVRVTAFFDTRLFDEMWMRVPPRR